ncbi:MAG TPA: folylpolyglutamate synthase/dihydrofolate synthase family protein [Terriglobia bacterium]|nr:folylpolyglutamate synthase/dihydrofolate synthase family protein [Terriglobia bacterium]
MLVNYQDCLTYLTALGHELRGVKFDLVNMRHIAAALGHPERKYPSVIVAGTNGKGSTSAMLASILECSGYRTGLYTSPHLVRVNERIRVDGAEMSDDSFALAFSEVEAVVSSLLAAGTLATTPSFFEFLTATAFVHFARQNVDFAVLEVGMGGRLDATNIVEPELAIITNVELDHTQFLGNTHAEIAAEKAGVIRAGKPVISGCTHPDAIKVVQRRVAELGAELFELPSFARVANARPDAGRYGFDLAVNGTRFAHLKAALRGRFQVDNASAAITAAWRLRERGWKIPDSAIAEGLARTQWPGRLEVCGERPLTLLDGAHNPAAARVVVEYVRSELAGRPLALVYASMRDKAVEEIAQLLFPCAAQIYLTQTTQPRAATPDEILSRVQARLSASKTIVEPDPMRALTAARRAVPAEGVVLACGSLFLVGAIKQALQSSATVSSPIRD